MRADAELLLRSAQWAGQHALALFVVTLALLLAAAWAGWWMLRRGSAARAPGSARALLALGARVALGFAIIVGGASVFAELVEHLGAEAAMGRADQAFTDALHSSVPAAALPLFATLTHLGDPLMLTVLGVGVALALGAAGQRLLALGWVAAVAGNALLNVTLKQIFERVRPLHDDGVVLAHGFSFPSGHSSGSVVAYGMLAYLALRLAPLRWHLPLALLAVTVAFTVGASRVFLRVHFASDVIAGFASGAAWLAVCIASVELARWYRGRAR